MRIIVVQDNQTVLDYKNTNKNLNKIPNTFEKLATQLKCPKCGCASLIEEENYLPSIDVICTRRSCRHTIEAKSILAEGSQKGGWLKDKNIKIKLGSVNTYASVRKRNKSLLVCWYNIIILTEKYAIIELKNCILIPMDELLEDVNCKRYIVLQRKKTKFKERVSLEIFPEFSTYFRHITPGDLTAINSMYTNRQNISKFLIDFGKFLKSVKNSKIDVDNSLGNKNRIIYYLHCC